MVVERGTGGMEPASCGQLEEPVCSSPPLQARRYRLVLPERTLDLVVPGYIAAEDRMITSLKSR